MRAPEPPLDGPLPSLDDRRLDRNERNRTLSPPSHPETVPGPDPDVHLRLDGVRKRFGSVVALDGLDLDVRRGEFYCLLGASAAGKTTALRVISGLEKPEGGQVVFDGEEVAGAPRPERGIAMVFQTFALYPHLSVFENLAYPLREARVPGAELRTRVGEMAEMLAISHLLERRPGTASGGEQQRVAIGRALIRRPRLLLLDEPLTNLDAKLRHDMRAEFKRLHRELGTTMLYATPDELEALGMGERIGLLHDGRIVQTGSPDELYEHPVNAYVGQMVGSPRMNLAPAERGDGPSVTTSFAEVSGGRWAGPLASLPRGAGLLLGFRPNDLRPAGRDPRGPCFPARVHLTEPLGDVTVLDLDIAEHLFRMVLPESEAVHYRAGDELDIELLVERTHLFDRGSGIALGRDGAQAR